MLLKWMVLFIALLVAGCTSIGPTQIKLDKNRYNNVIRLTDKEQLLENIVQLHYLEPVTFLKVTTVTSSYNLTPSVNGTAGVTLFNGGGASTTTKNFSVTPSVSYSDSPTITYTPVEGSDAINRYMTPVQLQIIHLISYGGLWDPSLLLRLAVQFFGDMDNASNASSSRALAAPNFRKYYSLITPFLPMFIHRQCILIPTALDKGFALRLHCFKKDDANSIKRSLGIPLNTPDVVISDLAFEHPSPNVIYVQLRSLDGIFAFLSHGVEVPPADEARGVVETLRNPDGTPFDWNPLMRGLWKVYWSNSEPKNAFVKVVVRNHWFYIKDSDLDSKETFNFVFRLMTLTAGQQAPSPPPVLTLPAGR